MRTLIILVSLTLGACEGVNINTDTDADTDSDSDTDTDTDADADTDSDSDTDTDTDADTDADTDTDCDTDTDTDATTGTLCWYPDASSVEDCTDRVDAGDIEDYTCDLDSSVSDGELWSMADGWTSDPVACDADSFDYLCGEVTVTDGELLQVNVEFVGDDSGSDAEIPSNYGGTWWACANWYGHLSMAGHWEYEGITVVESDVEVLSWGDGTDCFLSL